jgi:hypothetical protein
LTGHSSACVPHPIAIPLHEHAAGGAALVNYAGEATPPPEVVPVRLRGDVTAVGKGSPREVEVRSENYVTDWWIEKERPPPLITPANDIGKM